MSTSAKTNSDGMFGQSAKLPKELAADVAAVIADWTAGDKVKRMWAHDASLWTNTDEAQWLGWLDIVSQQIADTEKFRSLAEEIRAGKFSDVVLMGMGGSSLCPEVMDLTFGRIAGFPKMHVLDSTDPAQIAAIAKKVDLARTIFIVSSKSGTTLEPNIFQQYFYGRAKEAVGAKEAAKRFIAITDPGSHLEQVAKQEGFLHIEFGVPSIGGRYSALSNFGIVPAAVQGIDVMKFLERAAEMAALSEAVQAVAGGNGRFVAFEAQPGLGKTELLREAARLFAQPQHHHEIIRRVEPFIADTPLRIASEHAWGRINSANATKPARERSHAWRYEQIDLRG